MIKISGRKDNNKGNKCLVDRKINEGRLKRSKNKNTSRKEQSAYNEQQQGNNTHKQQHLPTPMSLVFS
ncbi:hypothetical protein [Roseimarinus sediminis]|jgi:hypothetical protein|uniref:hypothetical protein n=1 Tax=Roseimarinus sediminis TaxID=1610899 RepID=UPI003D1E5F45